MPQRHATQPQFLTLTTTPRMRRVPLALPVSGAKAITHSIGYLHENPVRRGLCLSTVDWKWSSARYYLAEPPKQQALDLPLIHDPPPGALD